MRKYTITFNQFYFKITFLNSTKFNISESTISESTILLFITRILETFIIFILYMDIDKSIINDIFEKRPTKDIYQQCLLELTSKKINIMSNENYDKKMIQQIDKVIQSIHYYLEVATI